MKIIFASALLLCYVTNILGFTAPQPVFNRDLDIDFDFYQENPEEWKYQEDCILRDGECDEVGEWIKARIIHRVKTGQCRKCTKRQALELTKAINYVIRERQDLKQEAINIYLQYEGQQLSKNLGGVLRNPLDTPEPETSQGNSGNPFAFLNNIQADKAVQSVGDFFKQTPPKIDFNNFFKGFGRR